MSKKDLCQRSTKTGSDDSNVGSIRSIHGGSSEGHKEINPPIESRGRVMQMSLIECNRIVVFLHPGQLSQGIFFPVTFLDCNEGFQEYVNQYEKLSAKKLYDGPPGDFAKRVPK